MKIVDPDDLSPKDLSDMTDATVAMVDKLVDMLGAKDDKAKSVGMAALAIASGRLLVQWYITEPPETPAPMLDLEHLKDGVKRWTDQMVTVAASSIYKARDSGVYLLAESPRDKKAPKKKTKKRELEDAIPPEVEAKVAEIREILKAQGLGIAVARSEHLSEMLAAAGYKQADEDDEEG